MSCCKMESVQKPSFTANREALIKVKLLKVKVKLTKKQYRQLLDLSK